MSSPPPRQGDCSDQYFHLKCFPTWTLNTFRGAGQAPRLHPLCYYFSIRATITLSWFYRCANTILQNCLTITTFISTKRISTYSAMRFTTNSWGKIATHNSQAHAPLTVKHYRLRNGVSGALASMMSKNMLSNQLVVVCNGALEKKEIEHGFLWYGFGYLNDSMLNDFVQYHLQWKFYWLTSSLLSAPNFLTILPNSKAIVCFPTSPG